MANRKKTDYQPHISPDRAPACNAPECVNPGVYKAPKSKEHLHDYLWFCLDHIREHNQKWDYFSDMNSEQIEFFMRDAVTGHRPTWERETRMGKKYSKLHDALYEFLHNDAPKRKAPPPLSAKLRKALSVFDIEYPYTARALKTQYRMMVKKHHPDVNKGNKQSEEVFKQITSAYHVLTEHLKHM